MGMAAPCTGRIIGTSVAIGICNIATAIKTITKMKRKPTSLIHVVVVVVVVDDNDDDDDDDDDSEYNCNDEFDFLFVPFIIFIDE